MNPGARDKKSIHALPLKTQDVLRKLWARTRKNRVPLGLEIFFSFSFFFNRLPVCSKRWRLKSRILCVEDQRKPWKSQDPRGLTKSLKKKQDSVGLVFWPVWRTSERDRAPRWRWDSVFEVCRAALVMRNHPGLKACFWTQESEGKKNKIKRKWGLHFLEILV